MSDKQSTLTAQQLSLRQQAEEQLASAKSAGQPSAFLADDKLLHELQVHQIELQMQNEELQRAYAALELSHNRYLDLYDFAPVGYLTLNADGEVTEINLTATQLFGVERKDIIKQRFERLLADEFKDLWYLHWQHAKQAAEKYNCDIPIRFEKGIARYFHLDCLVIKSAAEPISLRIALTDITTLKTTESALRDSNDRLQLAQKAAKLGIFDHNLLTGEILIDARLEALCGLNPKELNSLDAFIAIVHPDDRSAVTEALQQAMDPQSNGECIIEYRVLRPYDKQLIWLASYSITTYCDNQAIRLISLIQDISARKFSEAKLRDYDAQFTIALDELQAGYWEWDLITNAVFFSPVWKQQLGFAEHELPNRFEEWENRLHADDRPHTLAALEDFLKSRTTTYELEFRLRHRDGTYRWIFSRATLIHDHHNQPNRMLGIHLDISNFKLANENKAILAQMDEIYNLHLAMQMASTIAQELSQPLAALTLYADSAIRMLSKIDRHSEIILTLEDCAQQAQRAGQVIWQLLTVLDKGEALIAPLDINMTVQAAIEFFKTKENSSAIIHTHLATQLPMVISNDLHIQKIIMILLQNSLEAMQEVGRTEEAITVTTGINPNNPRMAQVTVCDCGCGVADADMLKIIFRPFYTKKLSGLGMGLTIARSMVEGLGGKIWAQANPDKGLSISFTMPFE